MPVIFCCTLILIFLIRYESKKHSQQEAMPIKDFLQRELEANTTRKKDISGLPYLTADCSRLPDLSGCPDPEREIAAVRRELQKLDGKKLLNLSGTSNTDLKLSYGAANFPVLSACDTHYTEFTRGLYRLGLLLSQNGADELAVLVLQYAVELKTDVVATYQLLTSIYCSGNNETALARLYSDVENLPEETRNRVFTLLKQSESVS